MQIGKWVCVCLLVVLLFTTGCSNVVRAHVSPSEFQAVADKTPSVVALHITDEFRTYKGKHVDWWCDATSYTMEMGVLATDWFKYALENQFEQCVVVSGSPTFPYSNADVDFVVVPKFTSFKAGGPVVVKLENYWVELGVQVVIQKPDGNCLAVLDLKEKGQQGGTPGYNPGTHVYPEVCRKAVKPIVDKTVQRLQELDKTI